MVAGQAAPQGDKVDRGSIMNNKAKQGITFTRELPSKTGIRIVVVFTRAEEASSFFCNLEVQLEDKVDYETPRRRALLH